MLQYTVADVGSPDWKLATETAKKIGFDEWSTAYDLSASKSPQVFGAALHWVCINPYRAKEFMEFWDRAIRGIYHTPEEFHVGFLEQGFSYPDDLPPDYVISFCMDCLQLFLHCFPEDAPARFIRRNYR